MIIIKIVLIFFVGFMVGRYFYKDSFSLPKIKIKQRFKENDWIAYTGNAYSYMGTGKTKEEAVGSFVIVMDSIQNPEDRRISV